MRAALLIAAGIAGVLYAATRTQRGQEIASDVLEEVVVTAKKIASVVLPRGLRNNNPGNIEWIENPAQRWRGMIGRDGRYGVFDTIQNGFRAIGGEIEASARKGQTTVAQIIAEWAPSVENDTNSYVRAVARALGVEPTQSFNVRGSKAQLAAAITQHENGMQPYALADIAVWVNS